MAKKRRATPSKKARQAEVEAKKAKQQRTLLIVGGVVLFLVVALFAWNSFNNQEPEANVMAEERPLAALQPEERADYYSAPPEMIIDPTKEYEAIITTENGDIRLRLFPEEAPITVNNFVFLANQGYYDNTTFHRVIEGFMAQAGDPLGLGFGGPGYAFADEVDNDLAFDRRGLLAMANSGPATNGSQFFITFAPATHLTGLHTIFGEVIEGDDVLSQVSIRDPQTAATSGDLIEQITIIEQ